MKIIIEHKIRHLAQKDHERLTISTLSTNEEGEILTKRRYIDYTIKDGKVQVGSPYKANRNQQKRHFKYKIENK